MRFVSRSTPREDAKIAKNLLITGDVVQVSGNRAQLSVVGPYEFVESVPAG